MQKEPRPTENMDDAAASTKHLCYQAAWSCQKRRNYVSQTFDSCQCGWRIINSSLLHMSSILSSSMHLWPTVIKWAQSWWPSFLVNGDDLYQSLRHAVIDCCNEMNLFQLRIGLHLSVFTIHANWNVLMHFGWHDTVFTFLTVTIMWSTVVAWAKTSWWPSYLACCDVSLPLFLHAAIHWCEVVDLFHDTCVALQSSFPQVCLTFVLPSRLICDLQLHAIATCLYSFDIAAVGIAKIQERRSCLTMTIASKSMTPAAHTKSLVSS